MVCEFFNLEIKWREWYLKWNLACRLRLSKTCRLWWAAFFHPETGIIKSGKKSFGWGRWRRSLSHQLAGPTAFLHPPPRPSSCHRLPSSSPSRTPGPPSPDREGERRRWAALALQWQQGPGHHGRVCNFYFWISRRGPLFPPLIYSFVMSEFKKSFFFFFNIAFRCVSRLGLKINVGHYLIRCCYGLIFKPPFLRGPVQSAEGCRRQVGARRVGCWPEALICLRKIAARWVVFRKLRLLMWSLVGRGLKGVQFLLIFINICWRANGFLCICVFPFSIGEITSNTRTSCDKIYTVQAERMDGWNRGWNRKCAPGLWHAIV